MSDVQRLQSIHRFGGLQWSKEEVGQNFLALPTHLISNERVAESALLLQELRKRNLRPLNITWALYQLAKLIASERVGFHSVEFGEGVGNEDRRVGVRT